MNARKTRAGLGASSVLLIIVVLCLTAFGALTLITARVDQRLTDRTEAACLAYYQADASAQTALGALDAALAAGKAPGADSGWVQTDGGSAQSFPIEGGLVLEVLARAGEDGFRVVRYRTRNEAEWESQTQWDLW